MRRELTRRQFGFGLAQYWSQRIDETTSDVMGILNMGPAAAIGLIAYFRGLNAGFGGPAQLRNSGPARDLHPADILRGYLGAATVRLLSFEAAPFWANVIEQETDRDLGQIRLAGVLVPAQAARASAEIVAEVLTTSPMRTLNNHSLIEIQNWDDVDEDIASELMVSVLKTMHDKNRSWGPMFVPQPSTITRHVAYVPIAREEIAAEDTPREGRGFLGAQIALAARGRKGA